MAAMKPADVAEQWNCSAAHVRRLCRREELQAMRLGSDWRISAEAVAAYEAAHTTSAATVQPVSQPARSPFVIPPSAEMDGALPDRWWEKTTTAPAPSAGRRGGSATKKKAASVRS